MPSQPPPPLDLRPVRFETRLGDLATPVVVETERGRLNVVEVLGGGTTAKVRISRQGQVDPHYLHRVPLALELGDFTVIHLPSRPTRAFSLPAGRMHAKHRLTVGLVGSLLALLCFSLIAVTLVTGFSPQVKAFVSVLLVLLALTGLFVRPRSTPAVTHTFNTADGRYALEHLLDDRPAAAAAREVVEEIKEEYGRLLSDIGYRIEFPALFDPADDAAGRFTRALIRWDTQQANLDGSELGTLAAEIRVAFEAARSHAETVGMDHLPEGARADAGRALSAARLAESGATPGERRAAMERAQEILAKLAIYYLPNPAETQLMIEGRPVLALPGRRPTPEA